MKEQARTRLQHALQLSRNSPLLWAAVCRVEPYRGNWAGWWELCRREAIFLMVMYFTVPHPSTL